MATLLMVGIIGIGAELMVHIGERDMQIVGVVMSFASSRRTEKSIRMLDVGRYLRKHLNSLSGLTTVLSVT